MWRRNSVYCFFTSRSFFVWAYNLGRKRSATKPLRDGTRVNAAVWKGCSAQTFSQSLTYRLRERERYHGLRFIRFVHTTVIWGDAHLRVFRGVLRLHMRERLWPYGTLPVCSVCLVTARFKCASLRLKEDVRFLALRSFYSCNTGGQEGPLRGH